MTAARSRRFQSTLPARGATTAQHPDSPRGGHFNPRSPHGERLRIYQQGVMTVVFQSTLPARGATKNYDILKSAIGFQSTLPARGATTTAASTASSALISIHAPRTGSDDKASINSRLSDLISIHAPRTGSDESYFDTVPHKATFQSTLPARGATISASESSVHG